MSKVRSTCKDWNFVSKGTEISVGRFLIEYFTPLTLGERHQGALSDEDMTKVWLEAKSEAISKVRRTKSGVKEAEAHCPDTKELEKTFWLHRPDGWVINKKTKRIIMSEFKHVSDTEETYYSNMKSIAERQHKPILEGSELPVRRTGMGGGSSTSSGRTVFGQGKRVVRDHEEVWDKRRGRIKNHL
jgi:hypothetical protein